MILPRRVLWKAVDGREFLIDMKKEGIRTMGALYEHIDKLREEKGDAKPTFVSATAKPGYQTGGNVEFDDLPEHFKEKVTKAISEVPPDPKKLN